MWAEKWLQNSVLKEKGVAGEGWNIKPEVTSVMCTEHGEALAEAIVKSAMDLIRKPTSLWCTSTYDLEERIDIHIHTTMGCYRFPFDDTFKKWAVL